MDVDFVDVEADFCQDHECWHLVSEVLSLCFSLSLSYLFV
jgi:hypothetical protein